MYLEIKWFDVVRLTFSLDTFQKNYNYHLSYVYFRGTLPLCNEKYIYLV